MNNFNCQGIALIISSPSGVGKSTLTNMLLQDKSLKFVLSISATTRKSRPSEIDGLHYHFISKEDFLKKRDKGEFLEYARVHDNFYGTPRKSVMDSLAQGYDVLLDIDYQGAIKVKKNIAAHVVSIFILPPSMKELRARLTKRASDSVDNIEIRLKNSCDEMQHWSLYDYVFVNDNIKDSYSVISSIILAEKNKRQRIDSNIKGFIDKLISSDN